MVDQIRWKLFIAVVALLVGCLLLGIVRAAWLWWLALLGPLTLLGLWDIGQRRHSILRNHPIIGHVRYLLEDLGPELHQYFVEGNTTGRPFDRDARSLAYERAKGVSDKKPFGTERDVYETGFVWLNHSVRATHPVVDAPRSLRVTIGGPASTMPYSSSVLNISAMSFGALGAHAVQALNLGAHLGGFAQDTGEGGLSPHHLAGDGDLIWEIGTGYFGCRNPAGGFDPAQFETRATFPQVKMIEIKLSQGAKPGHGGILPGPKVTAEIAATRGVPIGEDCVSPPSHTAFTTPMELMEFVGALRELSGGKPVGIKLCVGSRREFMAICRAMTETDHAPDFIVIDGKEGGTGAAPIELTDHTGTPLRDGLTFAHDALVGAGLRPHVRLAASGKLISAFDMAMAMALGADWINMARGFMFALGCIQAQRCHTNRCPVGVATQDLRLQLGLVVNEKAQRVCNFHHHSITALAELTAAAGYEFPQDLHRRHFFQRLGPGDVRSLEEIYPTPTAGALAAGGGRVELQKAWDAASPNEFS